MEAKVFFFGAVIFGDDVDVDGVNFGFLACEVDGLNFGVGGKWVYGDLGDALAFGEIAAFEYFIVDIDAHFTVHMLTQSILMK